MHDIRAIRENPNAFDAAMGRRGLSPISSEILAIDGSRRAAILAAEKALADRNSASKKVGAAKASGDEAEFQRLRALVSEKKDEISKLDDLAKAEDARLRDVLMGLPNVMYEDVPDGKDEEDNVEIRRAGAPPSFDFKPVEHFEIPAVQSNMDFEVAAKISGSRFVVLSAAVARIHRALTQFMLDTHIDENQLTEMNVPVLVRDDAMYGTDKLPKFGNDSYQTTNGWWLIPTSEVPLTYSVSQEILAADKLPLRYTSHTLCFRSEAGSAGKDTSGMLRQHQFEKVEMVSITHPDASDKEQQRMLKCAEGILDKLELPYRTILLCSGDTGFGARRTYDIEVWLPGQNTYREVSSISTTGEFQARRMNARFRGADGKPEFVHTLNGSGLAVGRTLIAVLENGQQEDGSVILPEVLKPYLGGNSKIGSDGILAH